MCVCVCVCVRACVCVPHLWLPAAVLEPSHRVKMLLKGGRMRLAEGVLGVEPIVIRFKQPVIVHSIQLLNSVHSSEWPPLGTTHQHTGTLTHQHIGMSALQHSSTPTHWHTNTLALQHASTLTHWHSKLSCRWPTSSGGGGQDNGIQPSDVRDRSCAESWR